ncbi:MAG: hypothetical protein ACK4NE_03575 [Albidovulum sp.]
MRCPTLPIVGGTNRPVMAPNRAAPDRLHRCMALAVVPGVVHPCEEPGTLGEVVRFAAGYL